MISEKYYTGRPHWCIALLPLAAACRRRWVWTNNTHTYSSIMVKNLRNLPAFHSCTPVLYFNTWFNLVWVIKMCSWYVWYTIRIVLYIYVVNLEWVAWLKMDIAHCQVKLNFSVYLHGYTMAELPVNQLSTALCAVQAVPCHNYACRFKVVMENSCTSSRHAAVSMKPSWHCMCAHYVILWYRIWTTVAKKGHLF